MQSLPADGHLVAVDVASPFIAPLRLALWVSVCLSAPVFLYQVWMFVMPGLYRAERFFVLPLFVVTVFLFFLGGLFVYYGVLPLALAFFQRMGPEGILIMTDINRYLTFVLRMILVFGLAFELPIVVFLAVRVGLVSLQTLRGYRRYVVVLCFVFGMLLTPPDIFSQLMLALPLYVLYEAGLLVAGITSSGNSKNFNKNFKKRVGELSPNPVKRNTKKRLGVNGG